ncbi:hypothetical protein [Roseivirga spongicola]|uniref:Uncharacterized protein n=1 Tax=Roseivirga spongicola TaxID=333140 RepID=A0A150XDQ9_9BACT|nr:hypothetical protein [Roseivirga spongicola]KYG76832.1 hypothetical protein AWW68_19240 [Roseivirga spongicola]WPZ12327.1 hypothetical protein T7867_09435 [Roseivirga spongicola]
MKGNKIDELFRNGLESHKASAPVGAWDKIEAGLPQKKKKGAIFWISIAASFTLLAAVSWLALDNKQQAQLQQQEILSEKEAQPESLNKGTLAQEENQQEYPVQNKTVPTEKIDPISNEIDQLPLLVADNSASSKEIQEEIQAEFQEMNEQAFELKIELIQPRALKPQFMARNLSKSDFIINTDFLKESFSIAPEGRDALENERKKKFGFLDGIVSMAKSVNSGAKAISEMRKSKNEWVSNDLKYGDKAEDSKEEDSDLKQQ